MSDPINHPSHYNQGKIEVIEFITDQNLNFTRGNIVKYVVRAGKKDPNKEIEDLMKARWLLDWEIEVLSAAKEGRDPVKPNNLNEENELS